MDQKKKKKKLGEMTSCSLGKGQCAIQLVYHSNVQTPSNSSTLIKTSMSKSGPGWVHSPNDIFL